MAQLGIEMIAAYSPQARGRSERAFRTLQDRLPKELRAAGITTLAQANRYLKGAFIRAYNREFAVPAAEHGSAFVSWAERTCATFCACRRSGSYVPITVWPTATSCCRFPPIGTAAITSR